MIKRSNDRVWIRFGTGPYYRMGQGFTHLQEACKTTLLETPHVNSPFCTHEILYHTAFLEFEGYRLSDNLIHKGLLERYLKRGEEAAVTVILGSSTDKMSEEAILARRAEGYVCLENPGSGEGPFGTHFKGKIIFATEPEKGVFNETTQNFISYA